jgi:hypothetical protein
MERWIDRASAESAAIAEHAKAYSSGQRDTTERFAAERAGEPRPAEQTHPTERPSGR